MKKMSVFVLAVAGLVSAAFGDEAKSYRVSLPSSTIGTVGLAAGEYQVLVQGDAAKVKVKDAKTGALVDVDAKVESAESKYPNTEVHTKNVDGVKQITEIHIGGTKFSVNFRNAS